ncbi:type III secretion system chaperone [Comamonas sp. NLF-1-9]|uniref:type III secretion system chaperone n=1 Tax=Comamonas sp. NLF-1-9 TaxID=2853163 RepID=UPI001C4367C5|nr:type III secretion system chaperone [Comamonas sp. NLF-1-9]QXL83615.1 type III secretion system chaperone [Comamonas sp. NLF-1-9]
MSSCDQLLLDLGQSAGLAQALHFDDQGCARLMVDASLAIDFERDAEAGLIQICSVLAAVPARGVEALYRTLLEANLFGGDTAGATLAIDAHLREIVLCRSVPAETTSAAAFVKLVEQFIAAAEDWRERVATQLALAAEPAGGQGADISLGAPDMGHFLRA